MEKLSITLLNTVLNTFLKLLLISGYRNSLLARYSNYCKLFTVPDLSKRKRSAAGGCSIRSRASAMSLLLTRVVALKRPAPPARLFVYD